MADLAGCAVGHIGWFLRDVWTREMVGGSTVFSEAPQVLWVSSPCQLLFCHSLNFCDYSLENGSLVTFRYEAYPMWAGFRHWFSRGGAALCVGGLILVIRMTRIFDGRS